MIDRTSRDKLAKAISRLAAGLITNDQYADESAAFVHSADLGIRSIHRAAWQLYDDTHEHRLEGAYALEKIGRRKVARWVLFLKSNLEYEWPDLTGLPWYLLVLPNVLTFGLIGWVIRAWHDRRGDLGAWPFLDVRDLESAAATWPVHPE